MENGENENQYDFSTTGGAAVYNCVHNIPQRLVIAMRAQRSSLGCRLATVIADKNVKKKLPDVQ